MESNALVQHAFTVFATWAGNSTHANSTVAELGQSQGVVSLPAMISATMSLLLSYSALGDWFKLIAFGGVIETCRRIYLVVWRSVKESVWISASFDENDASYNWIMFWFSNHRQWKNARTVDVSTRSFGLLPPDGMLHDYDAASMSQLRYLPSLFEKYTFWYKGHYMAVTRSQKEDGVHHHKEILEISILARRRDVLNHLLADAMRSYHAAQRHLISIYILDSGRDQWVFSANRVKRPLKSIILDPGTKDLLLNDARDFLESKGWYEERGIPFRRGYLLYGAPGSGKTSIIHSLAGELGLDVYIVSLSRAGMNDDSLMRLLSDLPEKCIALMEDIDAAFQPGITRNQDDASLSGSTSTGTDQGGFQRTPPSPNIGGSYVTLSGLLNALDGVAATEGRLLFATTNCYTALDPALCRPGRMDLHVEFKLASKYQAEELFKCFYLPLNSKDASDDDDEESLFASLKETSHDGVAPSRGQTVKSPVDNDLISLSSPATSLVNSNSIPHSSNSSTQHSRSDHRVRTFTVSHQEALSLAAQFSSAIPDRQCSMASLQGYLMAYKTRPWAAVEEVAAWVEQESMKERRR